MARLYNRDISAVSVKGRQYSADAEGAIEVPDDVAGHLIACFGLRDIGTGPPEPPPSETGEMPRLGSEDITAAPAIGSIEAPEIVAADLIGCFGPGEAPKGSFAAGIDPASEWTLEFAMAVAAKLGIDVAALIRWALLNAVPAMAQAAAPHGRAAALEEDAVAAGSNIDKPCADKPCALEGGHRATERADGGHSLHLCWERAPIHARAFACDAGGLGDWPGVVEQCLALGTPPKGPKARAASRLASLAAPRTVPFLALVGHRINAPPPHQGLAAVAQKSETFGANMT
jgi:hypothetical protein